MPIKCLNSGCKQVFDDLEDYLRHRSNHSIDEGVTLYADGGSGAMHR